MKCEIKDCKKDCFKDTPWCLYHLLIWLKGKVWKN